MRRTLLIPLFAAPLFAAMQPPAATPAATPAPAPRTGFLPAQVESGGRTWRYVLYVPEGYTKDRRWPLVLFLHGAGECGDDNQAQTKVGLAPAIRANPGQWPFLVVFPQKPTRESAWEDHDAALHEMVWKTRTDWAVDEQQMFLTGLSQGGHGTWAIAARHPERWAAIAPICGYGDPRELAPPLAKKPIWCFHGEDDKTVPAEQSRALCAAVTAAGGAPILTLFPHTGHDSWTKAYGETALPTWLRLAVPAPIAANYVARPETARTATLLLRGEVGAGDAAHSIVTATFELKDRGANWSVTLQPPGAPAAEPRRDKVERRVGAAFLQQLLRDLASAGVFCLPDPVPARPLPRGATKGTPFTIELTVDGKPGLWQFRREIDKHAEEEAEFAPAVRALVLARRAIEALK